MVAVGPRRSCSPFFFLPNLLFRRQRRTTSRPEHLRRARTRSTSGNVSKADRRSDKEQTLELELKKAFDGHSKISTHYPSGCVTATIFNDAAEGRSRVDTHLAHQGHQVQSTWLSLLVSLLPILLIVGVLFFVMSQVQGGGNRVMSFGRSKAKLVSKDTPKTTFADVAGADEAIEELDEIKEFLAKPGQVPGHRRQDPQGRAALRPARHR